MEMLCAAHGLRLDCSFALPGMRVAGEPVDGLPILTLALQDPDALERTWSGAGEAPEWRGRQGDGRELVIEQGRDGDVLFSYGDLARFRLDPQMQRLDCAPSDSRPDWQRVLIGKVIPATSVMLGYEALHAAAVESPDGVVAIMAPSGSGKSTLAAELLSRGWPLFADDQLTLGHVDGSVLAYPGTAHMNLAQSLPGELDPHSLGDTLGVLSGEMWLTARSSSTQTRSVRMLCLLERGADLALQFHTQPASPLALAPYILGLSSDPERGPSRFSLYADLVASTPLARLSAGLDCPPVQLADMIEQALAGQPQPLAGALS
jgi:hypothetical protein